MELILSNKPYILNPDKLDIDEHISRFTNKCNIGKCTYIYPFENLIIPSNIIEKMPFIIKEIDYLFSQISNILNNPIKSWSESTHGFEIFGADLLYDLDRNGLVLMEINHKPGLDYLPYIDNITKLLFGLDN